MSKLILVRGIQGSGKTTLSKQYCKNHPNTIRVNRDDIREMLSREWSKKLESIVVDAEFFMIGQFLSKGFDVIVDNVSNLNEHTIERIHKLIDLHTFTGYEVKLEYIDCFTPLEECIRRDSLRENPIGEEIIRKTYNKYKSII